MSWRVGKGSSWKEGSRYTHSFLARCTLFPFRFASVSEKCLFVGVCFTLLGAWVGAFPILLDWNRPWQVNSHNTILLCPLDAVLCVGVAYSKHHGCSCRQCGWLHSNKTLGQSDLQNLSLLFCKKIINTERIEKSTKKNGGKNLNSMSRDCSSNHSLKWRNT